MRDILRARWVQSSHVLLLTLLRIKFAIKTRVRRLLWMYTAVRASDQLEGTKEELDLRALSCILLSMLCSTVVLFRFACLFFLLNRREKFFFYYKEKNMYCYKLYLYSYWYFEILLEISLEFSFSLFLFFNEISESVSLQF